MLQSHSLPVRRPAIALAPAGTGCIPRASAGPFRQVLSLSRKKWACSARATFEATGENRDAVSGSSDDGFYMRRCVEIARTAVGCTSPNPMVGCVIVKDGAVVGEGFHPKAGQPHAEVFALRNAGDQAESATAYVSLEPCNHYGRTPPCTEALIRAKVKRVVVGMVDPNPIVASKGVERLRESGINVTVGVEEMLCKKLNEAYIHRMLTGKPFVTLRYSLSINGAIISEMGKNAQEPGGYYSLHLQENDCIIISSSTLLRNPRLPLSQEYDAKQPFIIIIARNGDSLHHLSEMSLQPDVKAIIFSEKGTVTDFQAEASIKRQGVEVVLLDDLKLSLILDYCFNLGMCSVLLDEGGDAPGFSDLLQAALEEGLVQKVVAEVLPVWSGAGKGSGVRFGGRLLNLKDMHSSNVNGSIVVEGYVAE